MHRYIPVLVKNAGFNKIGEKIVKHQARKYGQTKFGTDRFIKGFLDLITIWFVSDLANVLCIFGARCNYVSHWIYIFFILGN